METTLLQPLTLVAQLGIAALLGGIIGLEREGLKRPAGFRTHILVCVGATVAVHTNIQLIQTYATSTNIDPARLGAQVISGLGFLGAGTIIKEGSTVKGLTTAASLWVVGIIGLAVGSGQYLSATLSTLMLYLILGAFQRIEKKIRFKKGYMTLMITAKEAEAVIVLAGPILDNMNIVIKSISKSLLPDDTEQIAIVIEHPKDITDELLIIKFSSLAQVLSVRAEHL